MPSTYGLMYFDGLTVGDIETFQDACQKLTDRLPGPLFFNMSKGLPLRYFQTLANLGMLRSQKLEFVIAVAFMAAVFETDLKLKNRPNSGYASMTSLVLTDLASGLTKVLETDDRMAINLNISRLARLIKAS